MSEVPRKGIGLVLGVDEKQVKNLTDSLRPNGGTHIKTPVSPAGGKVDWLKSRAA